MSTQSTGTCRLRQRGEEAAPIVITGACEVKVADGAIDHRDKVLSKTER